MPNNIFDIRNDAVPSDSDVQIPDDDTIVDNEVEDNLLENNEDNNDNLQEQKDVPNKQRKNRFEYWQSQATTLQNQLKQYESMAPVVRYLQDNPQVITTLQEQLTGEVAAPKAQEPESKPEPELARPTKPVKPKGYNPFDEDSESESAKYQDALEKYYDDLQAYNEARITKSLDPINKIAIAQQKAHHELAQEQFVVMNLMQTKGWEEKKARSFVDFAKDDKNMSNLPEYFEWLLAKQQAQPKPKQPVKKNNGEIPIPISSHAGVNEDFKDDGDRFKARLKQKSASDLFRTM